MSFFFLSSAVTPAHRAGQHHDPKRSIPLEGVHQGVVDLHRIGGAAGPLRRTQPPAGAAVVQLVAGLQLRDDLFLVHLEFSVA